MLYVGTVAQKETVGDYLDDLAMLINKFECLDTMQPRQKSAYQTLVERKTTIEQIVSSGRGIIDLPSLRDFRRLLPKSNASVEQNIADEESHATQVRASSIWDEIDSIE